MDEREQLVLRVVSGDLDPGAEEFRRAAAADPELAQRVDRLLGLQAELDSSAVRDAILAEAAEGSWPEGEARAQLALEAEVAPHVQPAAQPSVSRPWSPTLLRVVAAAAAAAIVLVVAFSRGWLGAGPDRGGGREQPIYLGDELPGAAPVGPGSSYARFRWDLEIADSWEFAIAVYDDSPGASPVALATEMTRHSEWSPEVARTERWPDAIRWTLTVVSPDGQPGDAYELRASR